MLNSPILTAPISADSGTNSKRAYAHTLARRYRITEASITDDILNEHLQKASDGIDNDEDGTIDEYGEIHSSPKFADGQRMGLTTMPTGWTDETPGDATDGIDNNNNGQIDESGEFVAAANQMSLSERRDRTP